MQHIFEVFAGWTGDEGKVVTETIRSIGLVAFTVFETKENRRVEENWDKEEHKCRQYSNGTFLCVFEIFLARGGHLASAIFYDRLSLLHPLPFIFPSNYFLPYPLSPTPSPPFLLRPLPFPSQP